jgi:hypothetical protein
MATEIKVVLFEDVARTNSELVAALKKHLESDGIVLPFDSEKTTEPESERNRMYEDRLRSILSRPPYDEATLLVADRDLSMSTNFTGMSVSAVIEAAKRLGTPICSYARQPGSEEYKWRAGWEEGHILLSESDDDDLARQAILAARGFADIASRLPELINDELGKSPARALAAVLGKPEYADKIALYSVGDQNRMSEVPFKGKVDEDWVKRIGCFLGYWLWDSILRYPGLLVNEIAAASHLNIATADFGMAETKAVFRDALYSGPFADSSKPRWWRGVMDDLISREGFNDGLEFVRKKVNEAVSPSQCWVDPTKPAGYYCIISDKPVSLENSKGGLSWLPRGADLTRISTPVFEEYGPWIGS